MKRRLPRCLAAGLLAVLPLSAKAPEAVETLAGFTAEGSEEQRALERRFDSALDAENLKSWMSRIAGRPHHVGAEWGKQNAEFMAGLFRSWGYETRIETFEVLFPTPVLRRLEMTAPQRFTAALEEPVLAGAPAGNADGEALPPYNAYSIDGDVTGELVYVNYGLPEDYEELERHGVDVEGKVVIARYGRSWRGIKPKVAAENGAVGCIIYSDPRDDGFFRGDVYPEGGFRGPESAQRGSVADMPLFPGDPLTPGRGATADAERLPLDEAPTLTKIPVLPISYADARPLLEALEGPVAPPDWRGALPLTYHLGPGPARVRLQLEFDWSLATARNVIATLPGRTSPDRWVIRGNHHDAWVNGATDPVAGLVALLEEARAVGVLARDGWRPRRTIVYAAWDAEEPGLLGSVEWVEAHADELREKAVAYINSDGYGRGFLQMAGSHTLERFMNEIARDVVDPLTEIPLDERIRARMLVDGDDEAKQQARESARLRLGALGSGSDYTPFLQHLGIASLDLSFGGEADYGQYHSAYDSVDHFTRFMDPGFIYGVTLARTAGRATLRLADAGTLPFEFDALVETLSRYVDEVKQLADQKREQTVERNRLLAEGRYVAAADPRKVYVPPPSEEAVPHLNFAPLDNAIAALRDRARSYDEALAGIGGTALPSGVADELDAVLIGVERAMGREEGLPGRPWYTHFVYAPGFYTGYGVKTLPAVRETIELRQWDQVEKQIEVTAEVLAALGRRIARATEILAEEGQQP